MALDILYANFAQKDDFKLSFDFQTLIYTPLFPFLIVQKVLSVNSE